MIKIALAADITLQCEGFDDLAHHYHNLADYALRMSQQAGTIREARYYEGRYSAFLQVAETLRTATIE